MMVPLNASLCRALEPVAKDVTVINSIWLPICLNLVEPHSPTKLIAQKCSDALRSIPRAAAGVNRIVYRAKRPGVNLLQLIHQPK